ncbi:ABC transporter permease [Aliidongia dinghuensis]|uniref:ABC transporter permease n=1 Tax=Aliidongia dinghuensis TaxID=1867774 RepID=A0A8J3E3J2_9PROT|nr:ABC transporter permease [Aliidongia dinghuensis]GGF19088.1 ABC transporter permease [Aliidongia dinghuensis]
MGAPRGRVIAGLMILPAALLFLAFFVLPLVRLVVAGGAGPDGWAGYGTALADTRHLASLMETLVLSIATTLATLVLGGIPGLFLARNRFPGRTFLVSVLTLPLAFPGVVVGFMVILLAGRQGLIGQVSQLLGGERIVFAYSMAGLFLGYIYFSIPRVVLTVMASAEKLDPQLEEAARSLGASPWRVFQDVILPGLKPALISAGAITFATSMGAFGTAFTLATRIDVLPMVIYTEFTLGVNLAAAAGLSLLLGAVTWAALALARSAAGAGVAAAG